MKKHATGHSIEGVKVGRVVVCELLRARHGQLSRTHIVVIYSTSSIHTSPIYPISQTTTPLHHITITNARTTMKF